MKHIYLSNKRKPQDTLSGKVIDKIYLTEDQNQFVITFTDQTYINLEVNYDDCDGEYKLFSDPISVDYQYTRLGYIDDNNKFVLSSYYQDLVDLGVLELDPEKIKEAELIRKTRDDEREYELYLELKKKYELRDTNQE